MSFVGQLRRNNKGNTQNEKQFHNRFLNSLKIVSYEQEMEGKSKTKGRRSAAEDVIGMILAGRNKKYSVQIPHKDIPPNCFRPRKLLLKQKEFDHLMGETDGTMYKYCGRPELDTIIVGLMSKCGLSKRDVLTEDNSQNYINFDETCMVKFLYDISKELYILTEAIQDRIILLFFETIHPSHPNPLPGPAPTLLSRINEEKKEESSQILHLTENEIETTTIQETSTIKQELGIIESFHFIGSQRYSTFIDIPKLRVWRRFLHIYIEPAISNIEVMEEVRKRYFLDQQRLWRKRNGIIDEEDDENNHDTSSNDSSSVNKKPRASKKGKKSKKIGSTNKKSTLKKQKSIKSKKTKIKKSASKDENDEEGSHGGSSSGSDNDSGEDDGSEVGEENEESEDNKKLTKEQIAALASQAATVNNKHLQRQPIIPTKFTK